MLLFTPQTAWAIVGRRGYSCSVYFNFQLSHMVIIHASLSLGLSHDRLHKPLNPEPVHTRAASSSDLHPPPQPKPTAQPYIPPSQHGTSRGASCVWRYLPCPLKVPRDLKPLSSKAESLLKDFWSTSSADDLLQHSAGWSLMLILDHSFRALGF